MEYYAVVKKKKLTFCNSIHGPGEIMLSELIQSVKEKCHITSLVYGI